MCANKSQRTICRRMSLEPHVRVRCAAFGALMAPVYEMEQMQHPGASLQRIPSPPLEPFPRYVDQVGEDLESDFDAEEERLLQQEMRDRRRISTQIPCAPVPITPDMMRIHAAWKERTGTVNDKSTWVVLSRRKPTRPDADDA